MPYLCPNRNFVEIQNKDYCNTGFVSVEIYFLDRKIQKKMCTKTTYYNSRYNIKISQIISF